MYDANNVTVPMLDEMVERIRNILINSLSSDAHTDMVMLPGFSHYDWSRIASIVVRDNSSFTSHTFFSIEIDSKTHSHRDQEIVLDAFAITGFPSVTGDITIDDPHHVKQITDIINVARL